MDFFVGPMCIHLCMYTFTCIHTDRRDIDKDRAVDRQDTDTAQY